MENNGKKEVSYDYFWNSKNDRYYSADSMGDFMRPFFANGVFNGQMQVTANDNMTVTVAAGYGYINGKNRHFLTPTPLDLEVASGTLNRIDAVMLRRDDTQRMIYLLIVKGGSAVAPTAPQPTRDGAIYELKLADIYIAAGTVKITQAEITDTRMDEVVCGWVHSAVQQITYEQIYAQFKAFQQQKENEIINKINEYEAWKRDFIAGQESALETSNQQWNEQFETLLNELEEFKDTAVAEFSGWLAGNTNNWEDEFYTWFGNLKEKLTENVAINLQSQIGNMSELKTEDKTSLTAAVNEVKDTLAETVEEVNGSLGEAVKDLVANMDSFAKSSIYADDYVSLGRKADTEVGEKSIAYGEEVEASGKASQAFGLGTAARGEGQLVWGKYNHNGRSAQADNLYALIVGGGSSDTDRKDIYTLDWNGKGQYADEVWGKDIIADPKKGRWYYLTKALQMIESGFVRNNTVTIPLRGGTNYLLVTSEWNATTNRVYGFRARMYATPFDIWNNLVAPTASNLCATSAAGVTLGTVQTTNLNGYGITLTAKDFYVYYSLYLLGKERDY